MNTGILLVGFTLAVALNAAAQPIITNQPQNQTNIAGTTATFTVGATGTGPLSYQWRSYANSTAFTNIPGATEAQLTLANVQPITRKFAVVVSDANEAAVTSRLASLTVVFPPTITPAKPTASLFADVTLYATNGSTAPRSYQWLLNGEPIDGAVTNRLVVTNVQPTNAGAAYAIVSTYAFGSVTSQVATLTITPFTITPPNPTASLFADVTLLFTNSSGTPLSYQWLFNGEPIAGAVTNKLVVTNVQKTNAGNYAIMITHAFGSVTSQVATLKIVPFNSIYCFGDSWTDTKAIAHGCPTVTACPSCFWKGRYSNGPMWPEFLSTDLGLAYAEQNNYAVCGSTTLDIYNQVNSQLIVPQKPELSLYAFLSPGTDFLRWYPGAPGYVDPTNVVAALSILDTALNNASNTIQRLYQTGARAILFDTQYSTNALDVMDLGAYRAGLVDGYIKSFNSRFAVIAAAFDRDRPDLRLYSSDMYLRWDEVSTHRTAFGFSERIVSALDDSQLTNKSLTGPGADYLMWNHSHATSKFHRLWATWKLEALTNAVLERLEAKLANSSATIAMRHLLIGRDYTLQTSGDLASWNDVQTFTASAGTNQVSQALGSGTSSVFYRLQWHP